jgi:hypothetical protein
LEHLLSALMPRAVEDSSMGLVVCPKHSRGIMFVCPKCFKEWR